MSIFLTRLCRGFQTTLRANKLAEQVVAAQIARGKGGNYFPNGFACKYLSIRPSGQSSEVIIVLNDTVYPDNYNYFKPTLPVVINGLSDPTSQRSHDICTPFDIPIPKNPPFALSNIAISVFVTCCVSIRS
jgi:hypothetical protein